MIILPKLVALKIKKELLKYTNAVFKLADKGKQSKNINKKVYEYIVEFFSFT